MTWIFLSPAAVRMTSKSDFSSSPPPASPPPAAGAAAAADGHGRSRRHAEALLEVLQQLAQLNHREVGDPVEDLFFGQGCHLPGLPFFASVLVGRFCDLDYSAALFGGRGRRLGAASVSAAASAGSAGARRSRSVRLRRSPPVRRLPRPGRRPPRRRRPPRPAASRRLLRAARSAPRSRRPCCAAGPGGGRPSAASVRPGHRPGGPAAPRGAAGRPAQPGRRTTRSDPSASPPLITSSGLAREKSRRALATALTSPCTKVRALGPLRYSDSGWYSPPSIGQADQRVLEDPVVAPGGARARCAARPARPSSGRGTR